MIKKIKKVKGLGLVFDDYQADPNTPPFRRYNVIFGWNGSGKSTLSTLFDIIAAPPKGSPVEYECDLEDGAHLNTGDACPQPVRVFNQDYIDKNVNVITGHANAIVVLLGEASQDLHKQIKADEELLYGTGQPPYGLVVAREQARTELERTFEARGQVFTNIARTIGAAIGGEATRTYRKPQAEHDIKTITPKDRVDDSELAALTEAIRRNSMPTLTKIDLPGVAALVTSRGPDPASQLASLATTATALLERTVESEVIARLAEHTDIAEWVERGTRLHAAHNSLRCEYCQQELPADRVRQLGRHFNAADQKLKEDLDAVIRGLRQVSDAIEQVSAPDSPAFYLELQSDASEARTNIRTAATRVTNDIEALTTALAEKKLHTTTRMPAPTEPDLTPLITAVQVANSAIDRHNATTAEFEQVRNTAAQKLKAHYLSTVLDDVAAHDTRSAELKAAISDMDDKVRSAHDRIAANQAQVSSAHKGCDKLNKHLAMFLGHTELSFSPKVDPKASDVSGYEIVRGGSPATRLSEGEKTAIALVYFVVHLSDGYFNLPNGIIVIDDPVSSLDSNSMYQAFSVIKNAVQSAGQVFILTHNFDFLRLLLNWLQRSANNLSEYFLLKSVCVGDSRHAHLGAIDPTLKRHESEYHYLFKLLKTMRDEQDGTITKAYPVPNIARKVWETFLMFEVPNSENMYRKMEILKQEGVDEEQLDAINKFVNDQSHLTGGGFDPALVPGARKAIATMFDVMRTVAPRHFRLLDAATQ